MKKISNLTMSFKKSVVEKILDNPLFFNRNKNYINNHINKKL